MSGQMVPFSGPRELASEAVQLPALFTPDARAAERTLEFFTAQIRNVTSLPADLQGQLPAPE